MRASSALGKGRGLGKILVVEDDAATSKRRRLLAIGGSVRHGVNVRLHSVTNASRELLSERQYQAGKLVAAGGSKASIALRLIDEHTEASNAVVVAGATYGSNRDFVAGLLERGIPFVVEVRPSELMSSASWKRLSRRHVATQLRNASWRSVTVASPTPEGTFDFAVASLTGMTPHLRVSGQLFAAQTGGIAGLHRGTILGFASARDERLEHLVEAIAWARWIRTSHRRDVRAEKSSGNELVRGPRASAFKGAAITVRTSIANSEGQDDRLKALQDEPVTLRGVLGKHRALRVMELFAGAGGMGLGFLLADSGRYQIVHSAEVNPIYVETLRRNHEHFAGSDGPRRRVPESVRSIDLREKRALEEARAVARDSGGIDIVIGGPPCQGFSNANRNSWSRTNPNNRLFSTFIDFVIGLEPRMFVMENVQGVLWTSKAGGAPHVSVADHVARRIERAGYIAFPRLVDAAWFGVPQFRNRFFLVGLHKDLGYARDDFGAWGPFPKPTHGPIAGVPYTTVRDAIADLPILGNGSEEPELPYDAPSRAMQNAFLQYVRGDAPARLIYDHVTSRHAEYVLDRYRNIPPGGNWESVTGMMSNYADVSRTHSNIYRRLTWDAPAITIGHYRKAMLIHPRQHRGLSLREASRLQSFPDWFRFSGRADGREGGLVHKQQQLANAVCPLVTKALAEYLDGL